MSEADRVCAIDIGTNTLLSLVLERAPDGPRALQDLEQITRLGRGVDARGVLAEDAIERAIAALVEATSRARTLGVTRIAAVGTSAVRDARNRDVLIARARDATGVIVEPIDGAREAALTFRGALAGIALEGPFTAIDIGGGSTEIVRGESSRIERAGVLAGEVPDGRARTEGSGAGEPMLRRAVSIDVGSVRLFERHLRSEPPTASEIAALEADVDAAIDRAGTTIEPPLVALAGTACTLAAIARGTGSAESVHGSRLAAGTLDGLAARLAAMTIEQRRALPGVRAGREDVIAAGALLLARIAHRAGAHEVIVSEGGVRWGLALEMLDRP